MSRAVLFDFGGTLDADGLAWKDRFLRLYLDEGFELTPDRFDPLFHAADDALVGAIPATLPFEDTVSMLADGVTRALRPGDRALASRIAGRFVTDALAQIRRNTPLLAHLCNRYRLGIVSNFYGNLLTVCNNTGIRSFFSVIVDSTQVGLTKPDPRIFRRAVDELKVTPAAATFVGDSLARDMAGARAAGMGHVWLVGDRAESVTPCCPGDRVVGSLRELEAVLP